MKRACLNEIFRFFKKNSKILNGVSNLLSFHAICLYLQSKCIYYLFISLIIRPQYVSSNWVSNFNQM